MIAEPLLLGALGGLMVGFLLTLFGGVSPAQVARVLAVTLRSCRSWKSSSW